MSTLGPLGAIPLLLRAWMPPKKAANSWNCSRFQRSDGWSWHWAHWICTPRNTRETSPASSTAWPAWAAVRTAEPVSPVLPVAVIIAAATSSQGRFLPNCSVSHSSIWG